MTDNNSDTPEFTDEQLRAALKRMGRDARQAAFAANLPIMVVKDGSIVALHADGSEEIVEPLGQGTDAAHQHE